MGWVGGKGWACIRSVQSGARASPFKLTKAVACAQRMRQNGLEVFAGLDWAMTLKCGLAVSPAGVAYQLSCGGRRILRNTGMRVSAVPPRGGCTKKKYMYMYIHELRQRSSTGRNANSEAASAFCGGLWRSVSRWSGREPVCLRAAAVCALGGYAVSSLQYPWAHRAGPASCSKCKRAACATDQGPQGRRHPLCQATTILRE